MASWFYASEGKQQGPYPEGQFRDLVAQGVVRGDTLVWSEGMAGWQKAAEIPGLMSGGGAPPVMPAGGPPMMGSGAYTGAGSAAGGSLSVDFGILDFTWRTLVFVIGSCLIIPIPWLFVWYTQWIVSCVRVPGRPNLSFTGSAMAIVPWFFGFIVLAIVVGYTGIQILSTAVYIIQIVLYWMLLKWMIANIASNGQPVGLSFTGSIPGYIGWSLLFAVSLITIIGWAWVAAAQLRWTYRNIQGTRREIIFRGSGLGILWRGIVAAILCGFIIPIPWVYRWIMNWFASQTELVPRGSLQ
jgi:GYF domain 2